ncbi:hypothetical protein QQZ08_005695 [Neonectria magnoliae]|uniref:Uncharacterized protein n=1 Tax=Neonectria magnoliae TaxID=2732573 RepID=A0ABR1I4D4_9HYPO
MRPVSLCSLDHRVEKKSILMLNITRLYLNYVESVVPANISSKQGNKRLPLEIWHIIFEMAALNDKSHSYTLVQPQSLKQSKAGFTTLLCAEIPEWNTCGNLEDPHLVWYYEHYLTNPYSCPEGGGDRPFRLPDNESAVFRIPTAALDKKILFEKLAIPDVIAWTEQGVCDFCGGGRTFCAGCRDGKQIAEEWTSASHLGDCAIRMLCPLCMGADFAEDSISMQQELLKDRPEMSEDEYDAWENRRFAELGYM